MPKSTLHDWRNARNNIAAPSESVRFLEGEEGQEFLQRLVHCALFHFHENNGASIYSISDWLHSAGLDVFTACKPSYLKGLAQKMQEEICRFGDEQKNALAPKMPETSISVAQDEKFFRNKPCLVGIDLDSNYILLEKMADNRKADTWNQNMSQAMEGLPVNIIQSVSDEGNSLLKHVKDSLSASHSPDTYHIVQDVGRSGAASLRMKERHRHKELQEATEKTVKLAAKITQIPDDKKNIHKKETAELSLNKQQKKEIEALQCLQQAQLKAKEFKRGRKAIGRNYHPYDLQNGLRQSPEKVEALIKRNMLQCKEAIEDLGQKAHDKLEKARRLIPAMKKTLIFYFSMAAVYLDKYNFDFRTRGLIEDELMPAAYLQLASRKEKNKKERSRLLALSKEKLIDLSSKNGPYSYYSDKQLNEMWDVACNAVKFFQRSSSCVEGRNAQLTLKYHNLHRLSKRKLNALTVIHNFHLRRSDGTTAAQRFFKQTHENLLNTILERMPALSRPRKHLPKAA